MFLSPVKTFLRIVKKGSTEEFESLPYICTLLNSSLWTYYGITKPGSYLVATVNGFGVVVEIVYISLFLINAPPRIRAKTATIAGVVDVLVFAVAVFVTQFMMEGEMRIDVIGFMGAALNVVMYASPLSAMKLVWTTKSVEYMPFLLSLFLFLNGGVWTFYAFLVQDWFLGVCSLSVGCRPLLFMLLLSRAKCLLELGLMTLYYARTRRDGDDRMTQ
ncbi:hypothetical protein M8C21_026175 [Ambrosia artemisiifolia]|uniref:Bidirectional sugar transporter SWEET n=1 Tax=Ambrosia artemisiifolia TaxID=4212 RepID=A0AAD5C3M9_AMBAR|nr:hypothetical protein M8C21_026175 [Ambrosia artemisiifolia]